MKALNRPPPEILDNTVDLLHMCWNNVVSALGNGSLGQGNTLLL